MLRVDFNVEHLREEFDEVADYDVSATMALVAEMLVSAVNDEFETNGRGKWPELAESTKERKQRAGRDPNKMLFWDGALSGSIEGDYGPDWAAAQTGVEYAVYHVSDEPRTVLPLRDFFDVDPAVLDEAEELVLAAIAGAD